MTGIKFYILWVVGALLVLTLGVPGARARMSEVFVQPYFEQSWVHPMRWNDPYRYHFGPREYSPLVSTDVCLIAASYGGDVVCLDERHGFVRWRLPIDGPILSGITAYKGFGYGVTQDGYLFKFGLYTGNLFWREYLHRGVFAPLMAHDDHLYILTTDNQLWKYDLENRDIVWKYEDEVFYKVSLMGAARPVMHPDGFVVIGIPSGGVVAVDAQSGERRWYADLPIDHVLDDVDADCEILQGGRIVVSTSYASSQVLSPDGRTLSSWIGGAPRGGYVLPAEAQKPVRFLQAALGEIRLVDVDQGNVLSKMPVSLKWGYPQKPLPLGGGFVLIVFSDGPAIIFDIDQWQYRFLIEHGAGFSAPPMVIRHHGDAPWDTDVFLFSNYSFVSRYRINLDRLARTFDAAQP